MINPSPLSIPPNPEAEISHPESRSSVPLQDSKDENQEIWTALRQAEERFDALIILDQMAEASIDEITAFALEEAVRLTDSTLGYLAFTSADETQLKMHAWSKGAMDECMVQAFQQEYQVEETGLWGEAVRQRRPVITNDYNASGSFRKGYPEGHVQILRHMNIPVFDGDRIVAVAGVGNKPTDYDESDVQQLTLLMLAMWRTIRHKKTLNALMESEERYRVFLEKSSDAIWRIELNQPMPVDLSEQEQILHLYQHSSLAEYNDLFACMFGLDKAREIQGMNWAELAHTLGWENDGFLETFIHSKYRLIDWEVCVSHPHKRARYYADNLYGIQNNGDLIRIWGTRSDITDRIRREQVRTAINKISQAVSTCESLQDLYGSIHAVLGEILPAQNFFIALYDSNTDLLSYPYFVDQYDEKPSTAQLGKGLTAYVIRTGKALLASPDLFDELVDQGEVELIGAPSIDWLGVPLAVKGKIIGILALQSYTEGIRFTEEEKEILQFISTQIALVIERKQAEDVLRVSEARHRGIVEDLTEWICRWKEDGTLTYANESYARYMGIPLQNLIGTNILQVIYEDDREYFEKMLARIRQGEVVTYELRAQYPHDSSGELHWEQWTDRALYDEQGNLIEIQSVGQEITERKQREYELETIAAVSAALRTARSRADMLPVILDQLIDLLRINGAAIALRNTENDEVIFEIGRGVWADAEGFRLPHGQGVSSLVIENGEPYVCNDLSSDPRLAQSEFFRSIKAGACIPLVVSRQTIGILWVGKNGCLNDHDLHILKAIADMAASAINRASLYEQTQLRLQRLDALRAVDMAISASLDMSVTMMILLDQVTIQLGVDAACLLLVNSHTQMLEYAAGRGFNTSGVQRSQFRLGQGHAGRAALERQIISITRLGEIQDTYSRKQLSVMENFVSYIAVPLVAKGQIKGILELFFRNPLTPDPEWLEFLQSLGASAAVAIDNADLFNRLQRSNIELSLAYDATIEGWSRALEMRDRETEGHTQRVTDTSVRLARRMGIPETDLVHIRRGAMLHDIGKMAVPDNILLKPGPLGEVEWEVMRMHPVYAYQMLSPILYLRPALDIPYYHHENWDGSGYPQQIKGEQIPLAARIFAIVDVWDALRSDRPYRRAWTDHEALDFIRSQNGIKFDPKVVSAFLELMENQSLNGD